MKKIPYALLVLLFLFSFAFTLTSQVEALGTIDEGPWDGEDTNPAVRAGSCCYVPPSGGCQERYGVVVNKQAGDGAPNYVCACNPEPDQNPLDCPLVCGQCW